MTEQLTVSPLDIANWFFKKAEMFGVALSNDKIQHLLFLAQMHFSLKERKHLMSALFVCCRGGFYEASIRSILKFGLPLMPSPEFHHLTNDFLETIWQKYAHLTDTALKELICASEFWQQSYREGTETVIDAVACSDSFSLSKTPDKSFEKSKIMLSQHGPVKVSAWKPRKLDSSKK